MICEITCDLAMLVIDFRFPEVLVYFMTTEIKYIIRMIFNTKTYTENREISRKNPINRKKLCSVRYRLTGRYISTSVCSEVHLLMILAVGVLLNQEGLTESKERVRVRYSSEAIPTE